MTFVTTEVGATVTRAAKSSRRHHVEEHSQEREDEEDAKAHRPAQQEEAEPREVAVHIHGALFETLPLHGRGHRRSLLRLLRRR